MIEENLLNDMVEEDDDETTSTSKSKFTLDPRPGDENWEEFVLSKLTNREIDDKGHPSTAGLRRIAPRLLGKIIDSGPRDVFNPTQINDHRATIVYELVYINRYYDPEIDSLDERIIRVREVADAWEANIDGDDFKKFPTAIASTRAEGRALRKALLLSVAVKEEISEEEYVPASAINGNITSTQISVIKTLCKQKKIDVDRLIKWGKDERIEDVERVKAKKIIAFLNDKEKVEKAPKSIFVAE